ncbi:bifunctional DNA primase/polymerase [Streptomyces scabiei]|uniref:bifunctional DNA primase/polymerase n=1 Tax=Streptomyces scabiei TaxID=1930 RepID=UPI000765C8BA|nr:MULTISPECIES: bifunctional DNA primase/polymerase [Streptomyces]MBP5922852.1 bifunctional DNA primase/polymerase [Streptomyces sp. LBUM 1483]MDX3297283.1 bifunctional DNA primase/polymerase [Streptomyces scabiei]
MTHDPRAALLRAALDAAARGWPVIPLRPRSKVPALHGELRCPGTGDCVDGHRTFERRATLDPARIERCWTSGPFNIGIATGPAGLLVVDLDTLKPTDTEGTPDGAANFQALCERAGHAVPATRRIRTPSGGEHLYFTAPSGVRFANTTGTLTLKVDTRAWGGQVVAPGSITPHGPYTVLDDQPVANLPEWLQKALTAPQRPAPAPILPTLTRDTDRYATAVLNREVAAVAATGEGGRQAELLRAVRAVGRFVAWGDLDRADVEAAFTCGGESAGLSPAECRSTIRKALDYSIRTAWPRRTA